MRYGDFKPLENKDVLDKIESAEKTLGETGRILVRLSGTEPVIRVMAEGEDQQFVESVVNDVCEVIEKLSKAS